MRDSGGTDELSATTPATSDAAPRLKHEPALDGLRGLAVAGVLLFHGGHLVGGFLGVDAFFVLSGFLITTLLLAEARTSGRIALGAFWARRARRLLPALGMVLAAVALYAAVFAKPDELATIRGDALATIGYFANWRAIATSRDYWALFRSASPLDHTWSLAIEEQFYLVWPLLVAVVIRGCRVRIAAHRILVVSIAVALASFAWMLAIFDPADPSRVYFGTDTRIASILIGAALAAWLCARGPVRAAWARATLEIAGVAALAILAVTWLRASGSSNTLYRGGLFGCAIATAVVIAAAMHPRRGAVNRVLSFRPLCALGIISYGVYLWHWPIYIVLDEPRTHLDGWPLLGVRLAVTLVVAIASYRFVERPIRRGTGTWLTVPRVSVALATAAAVIAAIMLATIAGPTPRVIVADQIRRAAPEPAPVVAKGRKAGTASRVLRTQRVLVVGNSIALYGADEGFKRLPTKPALDILNLGAAGCRLLPEETRLRFTHGDLSVGKARACRDNWDYAVSAFRPDVVMLLVSEPTDAAHELDGHWTAPCEPAYDGVLETELRDQVRLLGSKGAHVVLTTAAYAGLPFKSPQWFQRNDCQNAIFRRVAASEPRTVMADLFAWICPTLDTDCATNINGVTLRPDGVHFRDASAQILAAWLITQAQHHGLLAGVRVEGPVAQEVHVRPTR